MPALNLDLGYFDHPKTRRLIGLLGRGAEVLPIRLWCYCGRYHSRDGSLAGYSAQEIESIVGWWGKPGEMLQAFVSLAFVDELPNGVQVHDWSEHAAHFEVYKERSRHAAATRWGKAREGPPDPDASSIREAMDKQSSSNAPAGQGRAGQGISPPAPRWGAPSARVPRRLARALVGAHPPDEGPPLRDVDQESPLWVIGVAKAITSPRRPVIPDGLVAAYGAWCRREEVQEPAAWRELLEEAMQEAAEADRRMAGGGKGR